MSSDYNRTGEDYRRRLPRPPVRGTVVDFHCHLLAARHADEWFAAADHYGIDDFVSMTPLEEAIGLQRRWGHRLKFIAVPNWFMDGGDWADDYRRCIDGFFNLGCRMVKFHMSPGVMQRKGWSLDDPQLRQILREATDRGMSVMTHVGDPQLWYDCKYTDHAVFPTRDECYRQWEDVLKEFSHVPWVGAHMAGNPEDLGRLQKLLKTYKNLSLDLSATKWIVREVSAQRDEARQFIIANQDRLLWGSDQVSMDDRGWEFYASRWWCHRKLWETAHVGQTPIFDPDLPEDRQPQLRGLALPTMVLQKLYVDNAAAWLARLYGEQSAAA